MESGSVGAEYSAAFSAARTALSRLERASLAARMPATWAESQQAAHVLIEARDFDESQRRPGRPGQGRGHARHR